MRSLHGTICFCFQSLGSSDYNIPTATLALYLLDEMGQACVVKKYEIPICLTGEKYLGVNMTIPEALSCQEK